MPLFNLAKKSSKATPLVLILILMHAQALRQSQPWLISVMRDLSGLGSTVVLTLFIVLSVTYLSLFSSRITALFVALSAMSGSLLVSMFKAFFGRLRPATTLADYAVSGLSFPSGHAAMSAIVFFKCWRISCKHAITVITAYLHNHHCDFANFFSWH